MKGTRSIHKNTVQNLVAVAMATCMLVFSAAAFSAQPNSNEKTSADSHKVASVKTAPVASVINLNKADAQTLAQLNGVGDKKAQAIIAYRESKGGFKSVDELLNVKGIGEKLLEKNRPLLSVN